MYKFLWKYQNLMIFRNIYFRLHFTEDLGFINIVHCNGHQCQMQILFPENPRDQDMRLEVLDDDQLEFKCRNMLFHLENHA